MSSSSSDNCGCPYCPNGVGLHYIIVVEGITNTMMCQQCTDLNGTFVLPPFPGPGVCSFGHPMFPCAFTGWLLTFQLDVNAKPFAQLIMGGTEPALSWTCPLPDCLQPMTLTIVGGNSTCGGWPAEIPLTPVPPTLAQLNAPVPCISNSQKICMQAALAAANLGAPLLCCYPPDPQACQNEEPCGCGTPVQAKQGAPIPGCSGVTLIPSCPIGSTVAGVQTAPTGGSACGCGCGSGTRKSSGGCGCGGGNPPKAIYSGGILAETQDRVAMLQAMITPSIPGLNHGPGHVNILNGIMALQIVLPDAGPYSPDPFLTYCSKTALQTEYGYGWQGAHKRQLVVIDSSTAQITDSAGSIYRFFNKSSAGLYVPAAGITNSLVKNSDGTYTETQPDGFSYRYSSSGQLARMQTLASQRYTLSYDGGGRVTKVLDPFSRRLTYSYDGSSHIRHIIDVGGRITTFSVDGSGNLASHTAPDGAQTNFRYDGAHKLIAHITPKGLRTSYAYDPTLGWCDKVTTPANERTTIIYEDGTMTLVEDPRGGRTTILYDAARNISGVINAVDIRTTATWLLNQLQTYTDGNGHRTSLSYTTLADNTQRVQAIQYPNGGRFTYLFDTNSHVKTLVDELGNRSTLLWDGGGNRIGVINALNERTTYLYATGTGQVKAEIDALNARTTLLYDSVGQTKASIDATSARTSFTYLNGQTLRIQNPVGAITTYLRDGLNRVFAKLDPSAFRSSFSFDSDGRLFRVQIPTGAITTTLFDTDGDHLATINPLGFRTTVIHDANENVIRTVNAAGAITTAIYDLANRRIATISPLNFRTTLTLDGADNVKRITDPLNHINTLLYDPCDRVIGQINPLSFRTSLILDLKGQRIAVENPLTFRTTTLLDAVGQTKAVIDPLLNRTTLLWDAAGHNIAAINARGFRTTTLVDLVGRPKATIDALNERTTLIRDVAGRQIAFENALTFRTTTLYDLRDLPLATIDALLHRNSMVYDPASRLLRMQNGVGAITTLARDLAGQVIGTVNPLTFRTTTVFDPVGRRQASIDANLNRTTLLWDAASRNIGTINALSNRTTQVLDAANRRIALIDANSHRTSFQFDAANQNIVQQDAVLNRTTFLFDGAGRRTRRVDGRSLITTYLFDDLSRLTGREYNDGTRNTFAYDQVGGRVLMYDGTGRTSMILDALERPQAVIQPSSQRVTYGYSPIGQRIRLVTPDGGLFTYLWDSASRIQRLENPLSEITTFSHDAANREIVDLLANGTRASITYDLAGQITKLANITNTSTTLTSFGYLYDGVGNRQRVVEASLDRVSWVYDHTYQLVHEARSGTNAYNVTHTWDPVGNRLVQNVGGTRTTVTYDKANEIIYSLDGTGRTTFLFDGAGNQARTISPALARTTYLWDGENRLSKVTLPTAVINTMTYNADSLRVQKQDSTGTTKSIWDGQNILLDANASNVTQSLYSLNPNFFGNLLSQSRGGTLSFFQFDALGSTVALASTLGSVTDSYLYKAFGEAVDGTGSTVNSFRFVGKRGYQFDTDLATSYLRARFYDPKAARFLTRDPSAFNARTGLYIYSFNRPLGFIDPSGLVPLGPPVCVQRWAACSADAVAVWFTCMADAQTLPTEAEILAAEIACGDTRIAEENDCWVDFAACVRDFMGRPTVIDPDTVTEYRRCPRFETPSGIHIPEVPWWVVVGAGVIIIGAVCVATAGAGCIAVLAGPAAIKTGVVVIGVGGAIAASGDGV